MKLLGKIFLFWLNVQSSYDLIKVDPEKKEKSVTLGVRSLIMSIIGIIATVGFVYLTYLCLMALNGNAGLGIILIFLGVIVCAASALACFAHLVLASVMYAIYQMKLNKRKIGVAALVVSLFLSVGTIVAIIIILSIVAK